MSIPRYIGASVMGALAWMFLFAARYSNRLGSWFIERQRDCIGMSVRTRKYYDKIAEEAAIQRFAGRDSML